MKKRWLSILVIAALCGGIFAAAKVGLQVKEPEEVEETEEDLALANQKETLYLWYTDEELTDYLSSVSVTFNEEREDVRVIPVLASGQEYLDHINAASVEDEELPDLYIVGNDSLQTAFLAGLAVEIEAPEGVSLENMFPEAALRATTVDGRVVGYPLYFETGTLLYNSTYLENWAKATVQARIDQEEGEQAQAESEQNEPEADQYSDQKASEHQDAGEKKTDDSKDEKDAKASDDSGKQEDGEKKDSGDASADTQETEESVEEENTDPAFLAEVAELIEESRPDTFSELLTFADEYDAPEQMEGLLKWDVTDIFYNYFFIGDAINVGGMYGDDVNLVDLYNERAIRGMHVYQSLNQFFSMNTEEISYDSVLQDFIDGKIMYMFATSDAVDALELAKEEGRFEYDYDVCLLPDIMENYPARSLSVTDAVVINGFSKNKGAANEFAAFLAMQDGDTLYQRTTKLPAISNVTFTNTKLNGFVEEYERSVPVAKMPETSNYWVKLEMAFAQIWDGKDPNESLRALAKELMEQILDEDVTIAPIEVIFETEELEYFDEAEEKAAAQSE